MKFSLPLGIDDYKTISTNCFYADKTMFIKDIIDYPQGCAILYTRPRRFGKSLNLSMLKTFFNIEEHSKEYFVNKKILQCDSFYTNKMNSYPVISLSLNNIIGSTKDQILTQFKETVSKLYYQYKDIIYNDLSDFDKKKYNSYIEKTCDDILYTNSILQLCEYLYNYYNKKCIVLIDEYDAPLQNAYDNGLYNDIHLFFKTLFLSTLKSNNFLEKGVIFGVMEVAKGSLFSGLNNVIVNTLLTNSQEEYFGFNNEDVETLLKYNNKEEEYDTIRKWYGGYNFSQKEIYNPWSILCYIRNNQYELYWTNTGSNSMIGHLLDNNYDNIIKYLPDLLNDTPIFHNIDLSLSYNDIVSSEDSLFSFLLSSGYISIIDRISAGQYLLKLPNEEIKQLFKKEIIDRNHSSIEHFPLIFSLRKSIENNDTDSIKTIFENYILKTLSYYDFSNEKNYQIMLLSIVTILFENFNVKSEVNTGLGRCDIIISSKQNKLGVIFEIKHSKTQLSKQRAETHALSALNQIEKNNYIENISNQEHIIIYGISFQKKSMTVKSKIIK